MAKESLKFDVHFRTWHEAVEFLDSGRQGRTTRAYRNDIIETERDEECCNECRRT